MDLPIDHFRLLGVSPSAVPDAILRKLQSRCDSAPDQGFTHDVLIQRDELLRRSADLLTDPVQRSEYEAALLSLSQTHPDDTVGLDLPASSEVAALILLWEANASVEAFQLARQGLQPPQAPALGSGRESDLTLLAALACRDAAAEEQRQRRYETAAQLLRDGIDLQRRMGKLPEQQRILEEELVALLPYRILDLLSRDLGDLESHQQGLALFDQLVRDRGGLEGSPDAAQTAGLQQQDFEPFFKQIRRFLTVQEQVDLFSGWHREGSDEAGFLAVFALTASGFSRRKPERLEQAREQLQTLSSPELDPMPLLGCLDLLLGNVSAASNHFLAIRDPELLAWLDQHPGDALAAQCEYCRVWLERDVLPGYRDVDAQGVDLDAWFADRDVQAYVDRLDRKDARRAETIPSVLSDAWSPLVGVEAAMASAPASVEGLADSENEDERPGHQRHIAIPRFVLIAVAGALAVLGLIAGVSALRPRKVPSLSSPPNRPIPASGAADPAPESLAPPPVPKPAASLQQDAKPDEPIQALVSDEPTELQLQELIQSWLDRKAAVLAGEAQQDGGLNLVARKHLVNRVLEQRAADRAVDRRRSIDASTTQVDLVSRSPRRLEVKAQIAYADKTIEADGSVVETTKPTTLTIRYIFGRDGKEWKLHEYVSAV